LVLAKHNEAPADREAGKLTTNEYDAFSASTGEKVAQPDEVSKAFQIRIRRDELNESHFSSAFAILPSSFQIMSAPKDDLLRVAELALACDWDAAHQLVQQYEDDTTAAWIHAVLHKLEGDLGNARYWYRRADRMDHVADEPHAESIVIRAELTSDRNR
jgi:hypothetical protein